MGCFKFLNLKRRSKKLLSNGKHQSLSVTDLSICVTEPAKDLIPDHHEQDQLSSNSTVIKRFSWSEIEKFTMNFAHVIGEGGYSTVYLGYFPDFSLGAIKIHCQSERLRHIFKKELEVLLHVQHKNIVKLLGYCDDRGVLLLEFVPNGDLHEKLHNQDRKNSVLPWNNRMLIAYQLAQAIDYLHGNCKLPIVHGDIKASNVLLDHNLNCKLCDFGYAKMGFSSVVVPSSRNSIMGSPGYIDPHYLRTGIVSKKNDVYSFGVIVLELITGIEAFCTKKEKLLTSIANPILQDPEKAVEMVDSRLEGQFKGREVIAMASIASLCLRQHASLRPSMTDILNTMKECIPSVSFVEAAGRFKDIATSKMEFCKYLN
ncbi:probable receptor-like protein kinase At4g10390 isoform X2 [Telopea speciosissima]|uniref:probable receptor-like protein kinase At4g10390 isoform X2 n=1 Tax=Telopea speciosissima TaxID=54955 RepID=UPI001CC787B2|nr:probable receptor-like protein kinase At4g10390 isoform X2 [Telopea speciosissima]